MYSYESFLSEIAVWWQSQIMVPCPALPLRSIKPILKIEGKVPGWVPPWVVNLKHHRWCYTLPSEGYVLGTLVFVCHWTRVDLGL